MRLILLSNQAQLPEARFRHPWWFLSSSKKYRLQKEIGDALSTASAAAIVQVWIDKFQRTEDRYVEIKEHSGQMFYFLCHPLLLLFLKMGLI